jgi:DNA repair exonuclease SbcCD ATPase subunit
MRARFALALFLAVGTAVSVHAQSDDSDRLRAQLRQVTLQLRQAQDDQASIQAQKVAAESERDAVKKQLASAQAELARVRHNDDRAAAIEGDLAKTKDALAQATEAANQQKAERDKLQAQASDVGLLYATCQGKNIKLLDVSREILDAYENFDFIDSLGVREPFVQTKRVELENLTQNYRDRIDDGVFDPRDVSTAKSVSAAPSSATGAPPPAVKH